MAYYEEEVMFERGVRCVVMPCCGFTFDAEHTDGDKVPLTWTCPLCVPSPELVDVLREIVKADPVDMALDPNWAARVAREALSKVSG